MTGKRQAAGVGGDAVAGEVVLRSHDLAALAGTTPRALRHYHKIGLLPEAPRDPNGYRRYSAADLVRVLRIRQLAASGLALRKIGSALERDAQSQAERLTELDRELAEQAERIKTQRRMLAELRRLSIPYAQFSASEHPTATQALDHDVWTLVTAGGVIESDAAAILLDALRSEPLAAQAAGWYPEFEGLEEDTHIDDASADRLAHRMADFADAVMKATGFTATREERPVMALVEQMQSEALSPAQQHVWTRFRSLIETRWAESEPGSSDHEPSAG